MCLLEVYKSVCVAVCTQLFGWCCLFIEVYATIRVVVCVY